MVQTSYTCYTFFLKRFCTLWQILSATWKCAIFVIFWFFILYISMFAQRNLVKVYILSFLVLLAVSRCITLHCKVIWNDFVAPTLKLCSANPGGLNLCAFALFKAVSTALLRLTLLVALSFWKYSPRLLDRLFSCCCL